MTSIINNVTSSELEECDKEDFAEALSNINSGKQEVRKLSNNVRKIILGITELAKNKQIDIKHKENPGETLLTALNNSDNISEIGIGKKISDILEDDSLDYKKIAYHDQITGLPNNLKLKYDIEKNEGNQVVILIKIVGFEELNKTYGYEGGNKILNEIKETIEEEFKKKGFKLYRESGVTFGLVKKIDDNYDNSKLITYIENHIEKINLKSKEYGAIPIRTNVGLDIGEKEQLSNAILALQNIDKDTNISIYTKELRTQLEKKAKEKNKWQNEVKNAIKEGRLIPFFQGIRDNRERKITKYESLVRIKQGEKIISPFFFLKHIEGTELMKELTKTMIVKTIEEMKNSINSFSVNLNENDLSDKEIQNLIKDTLNKNGINSSRLTLEILEDSKGNNELFNSSIKAMKELGVKIAIDDFGTGYSGFNRIYESSPDYLKIDGSLIKGITEDDRKKQMIDSIVYFAHSMGSEVIAEYVENQEIQETLEDMGVDFSQGYLYSKPSEKIEI